MAQSTGIQAASPMQRALPSSIDDLQRAITTLEGTIYNLQSQLHPLLDETQEGICESKGQAVAAPYHYSVQISDVVSRIRSLNSVGTDLLQRLHV
jgi:two-component SAPR family response regulator